MSVVYLDYNFFITLTAFFTVFWNVHFIHYLELLMLIVVIGLVMGQFLISNMVIWSNNSRQGLAITYNSLCKARKNMSQCPSEDITPSCHASFFRRLLYLSLSTDGLVSLRVVTDLYNRRITMYVWSLQQASLCSNNSWSRQSCCHDIIILGKKGSVLAYNTRSVYCWDWPPQSWVHLTK